MSSKFLKRFFAALLAVAVISLSINIVLFCRLSKTRAQIEHWKKAHQQLVSRLLRFQKEQESAAVPEIPHMQSALDQERAPQSKRHIPSAPPVKQEEPDAGKEEFHGNLAWVISERFPELHLTDQELIELTGTMRTIRESLAATRMIKRTNTNTATIKMHHDRLKEALEEFELITGMGLAEFIRHADLNGGTDNDKPDNEEIVSEYLRDPDS